VRVKSLPAARRVDVRDEGVKSRPPSDRIARDSFVRSNPSARRLFFVARTHGQATDHSIRRLRRADFPIVPPVRRIRKRLPVCARQQVAA
jgi:hypothetical protein